MTKAAELAKMGEVLTNSQLGGRRNIIINGAMQVAQRGTSSTGQTSGGYKTVDRYRTDHAGFTGSYTQDTSVPSGYGFSHSHKIEVTTAASSDAGTLRFDTRVEAQDLRKSGWNYTNSSSYITFSCWVKSSLAGTYYFGFVTFDGTGRQYSEAFTLVADTWKKLEINIPGDSSVTFNDDNGLGALIALHIDETTSSSDSGHTLNGWQNYSSSSRTPDFTQDWSETLNATFHTTGWQLEVGEQATPFEHRSFGEELALCQRYFEKSYSAGTAPASDTSLGLITTDSMGGDTTTAYLAHQLHYRTPKRAAPTVTIYDQAETSGKVTSHATGVGTSNNQSISTEHAGDKSISINRPSGTAANGFRYHYTADAEL